MNTMSGRVWGLAAAFVLLAGNPSALIAQGGSGGIDIKPPAPSAKQPPAPQPSFSPTNAPPAPGQHSGPEVDLRPHLIAGKQTRYTMDIISRNSTHSPTTPDMDQDQKMKESLGLSMKVIEVGAEGGGTVELVYESVKMNLDTGDMKIDFDSTRPTKQTPAGGRPPAKPDKKPAKNPGRGNAPPAAEPQPEPKPADPLADDPIADAVNSMLRGMVGTKLTLKVDAGGNITSVTGGESLGGGMGGLGGVPGLGGGMGGPGMQQGLAWLVSGPGQRGKAYVGESWTNDDTLSNTPVGSFKMTTKHTLRSFSHGLANLAFTGRIEMLSEGGGAGPLGFQVKNSRYDGTYQWDTDAGALKEMQTDMSVEMDGQAMGTPMNMKSDTTFTVKRAS